GFRIIGPHAFTIRIGDAEKVLRDRKPLVCGLAVPGDRLGRVSRHTPSEGMHESDVELGARIAGRGKRRQPPKRGRVIAAVGSSDGIVELRCGRGTNEAEKEDEKCESYFDHASTATGKHHEGLPDDTIKTATV